jgi:hypothetical protein
MQVYLHLSVKSPITPWLGAFGENVTVAQIITKFITLMKTEGTYYVRMSRQLDHMLHRPAHLKQLTR